MIGGDDQKGFGDVGDVDFAGQGRKGSTEKY